MPITANHGFRDWAPAGPLSPEDKICLCRDMVQGGGPPPYIVSKAAPKAYYDTL